MQDSWLRTISIGITGAFLCGIVVADEPLQLPGGVEIVEVDFERHVSSLFGRLGCNSAACHGSFQGKGGFRLSLFGQSPERDFSAIHEEGGERRVNEAAADDSLLLRKPSGREDHGGGVRMSVDSWEYRLIRRWIASGAQRVPDHGVLTKLNVVQRQPDPASLAVGQRVSLHVMAEFAVGTMEDVTPFAEFRSRDESVATIDATGTLVAAGSGETAIVVSYRGMSASLPVFVPYLAEVAPQGSPLVSNWIDEEIYAQLARLKLSVSPPADDAEFLRRVSLDVIGTVPAPEDVVSFLANTDSEKRAKKIEELLHHPRRSAWWATRMCDITACNVDHFGAPDELRPRRARMWHDWFRKRFAENLPYDQIVHGVLCASSRRDQSTETWLDDEIVLELAARAGFETNYEQRPGLDLFWQRIGPQGPLPVEDLAELTASAFLGLRLHCARCHQHPYDHWTQNDFAGYANIFARVEYGSSTELRTAVNQRLELRRVARREGQPLAEFPRVQEVYLSDQPRPLADAFSATAAAPRAPGGPILVDDGDPREALFHWLIDSDNPYFAANFVNRVWATYFGKGLVEPVDDFSAGNPATHPQLLVRLSQEFVRSGYDIRALEWLILSSQAYQRSSRPAGNNAGDQRNFAHATVKSLPAEVLIDSLNSALEATDDFGRDAPPGSQAVELAVNRFSDPSLNDLFRILGRGDRKSFCQCDRSANPTIRQSLLLMSDERVLRKIPAGRLTRLLGAQMPDAEIIDEFYLATLSRFPEAEERQLALQHLSGRENRTELLADVVWALINTREFVTNH